jgi:hypothetical protein
MTWSTPPKSPNSLAWVTQRPSASTKPVTQTCPDQSCTAAAAAANTGRASISRGGRERPGASSWCESVCPRRAGRPYRSLALNPYASSMAEHLRTCFALVLATRTNLGAPVKEVRRPQQRRKGASTTTQRSMVTSLRASLPIGTRGTGPADAQTVPLRRRSSRAGNMYCNPS